MSKEELQNLRNNADLNWCVDIFKRIESIVNNPNVQLDDLKQVQYLVKQGLKVIRDDE